MKTLGTLGIVILLGATLSFAASKVKTDAGEVEGRSTADGKVQEFLGIPFAAPPVGDLRWKEPQPVKPWKGVREATEFGARCMQTNIFPDMVFRDSGPSEDCLYLNVWTPDASTKSKLPVMVWIYGGGFVAGATSEPRQDGQFLAHKGVVVVSMNYRLGVFGFFAHPELTKESPHYASGNYGLMDQTAALQWVKQNIANFGGDPKNITIFGESAGSFSVSAQMASPLSKHLIAQAIGESGAFFGRTLRAKSLSQSEESGTAFGKEVGADSLAKLRAIPAEQLLQDASKQQGGFRFGPNIDGYFFPATPLEIYSKGEQAHVPLLAGWNHDEGNAYQFFAKDAPTKENFIAKVKQEFGAQADDILKAFPHDTDEQAIQSAGVLATANFIAYGTWKWIELQSQTDDLPVYRYEFDRALPLGPDAPKGATPQAYHSSEIEYVFGTLASKKLPFTPDDYKLSERMQTYWTNFAKTGNPNGKDLPQWPQYTKSDDFTVMYLSPNPIAKPDAQREEYVAIDKTAEDGKAAAK